MLTDGRNDKGVSLAKTYRILVVLAVVVMAGSVCFAQSGGEATYKAKCLMCHGAKGAADTPVAKNFKMKPVSDPTVKALSAAQMMDTVKNGLGKMPSFKDKLTEAEIKDAVAYFRSLK
jgi:mono/diheme cytochrome c family protein